MSREDHSRVHSRYDALFDQLNDAVIKVAEGALRAGLLINGGAAVSVLAFIGSLAAKDLITASQLASVADSLEIFAICVAAAVAGMGPFVFNAFLRSRTDCFFQSTPDTALRDCGANDETIYGSDLNGAYIGFSRWVGMLDFFVLGMFSTRHAIVHLSLH
jgi:hypothetical protein